MKINRKELQSMAPKVGFNEVQAYAKANNVDFKTAAKKLGLSEKEAADLEKLGGNPGAPVDGFQKKQFYINGKPVTLAHTYKLKSGRQVEVYKDTQGKDIFKYKAADGTYIQESHFKKAEGMEGKRYVVMGNGQLGTVKDPVKQEEGWWDKTRKFVKENAGYIAAGTAVVGAAAGGAMCATGVGASVGAPLLYASLGALGIGALTSCTAEQSVNISLVNDNSSLNEAINALKDGQDVAIAILQKILAREVQNGTTLEEILSMVGGNQEILNQIAASLPTLFKQVIVEMNNGNQEILKAISNLQASVDVMTDLIAKLPSDIKSEFQGDLTAIINAIKQGNTTINDLTKMVEGLAAKLEGIIDRLDVNNSYQKDIKEILEKIQSGQMSDSEKILAMVELLKNIEKITGEINNKLDAVINKLNAMFAQNENIQKYLERIEEFVKQNNNKTDVTNNLLEKLLEKVQGGGQGGSGLTEAQLEAILKAISENGNKIDTTNSLLEQLLAKADSGKITEEQFNAIIAAISKNGDKIDVTNKLLADIKSGQEYIYGAINKFGVDILNKMDVVVNMINNIKGSDNAALKAALEDILKQLVKMDANQQADTQKILDAISKIKISGGGSVDLSSVEAMLAELIKLVGQNGKQLSDINAKLDVLNITAKAIEDKLDASNKDHKVIIDILNALKNSQCKGYDDSKLLAILDLISGKLDDILAAIKDHDVKVTVDVTGKVTCDCNCGGNHEGILGDLDNILG